MQMGMNNSYINGSVSQENREQIINDFQLGKIKILIANPQTMAESVSLHHACHDAIYYELNFNLVHFLQSRDRIHRLGLPKNQYTQYYIPLLVSSSNNLIDNIARLRTMGFTFCISKVNEQTLPSVVKIKPKYVSLSVPKFSGYNSGKDNILNYLAIQTKFLKQQNITTILLH